MTTRPSSSPLVPPSDSGIFQEVAEIDARGRLRLPPRWANIAEWVSKGDIDLLIVLSSPGRLSLHDWSEAGELVLKRFADLSDQQADEEALRIYLDRYRRGSIGTDRRVTFDDATITHLGLPLQRPAGHPLYVSVFKTRIEILSVEHRNQALLSMPSLFVDLP